MTTKPRRGLCGKCGGTRTQHLTSPGDPVEGCWCPRCLQIPEWQERCQEFDAAVKPPVKRIDRPVVRTGHQHPETSELAGLQARLQAGTRRRQVFDCIARSMSTGMTDDEIERMMGKSHQTISATRNTLMNDGLIVDSGQRRRTQFGNQAIVWVTWGQKIHDDGRAANS